MSGRAVDWVVRNTVVPHRLRLVLIVIASHADKDGEKSYPKIETIAEECDLSERQVRSHLKELLELGAVTKSKRRHIRGNFNIYEVVMDDSVSRLNRKPTSGLNRKPTSGFRMKRPEKRPIYDDGLPSCRRTVRSPAKPYPLSLDEVRAEINGRGLGWLIDPEDFWGHCEAQRKEGRRLKGHGATLSDWRDLVGVWKRHRIRTREKDLIEQGREESAAILANREPEHWRDAFKYLDEVRGISYDMPETWEGVPESMRIAIGKVLKTWKDGNSTTGTQNGESLRAVSSTTDQ